MKILGHNMARSRGEGRVDGESPQTFFVDIKYNSIMQIFYRFKIYRITINSTIKLFFLSIKGLKI